MTSRGVVELQSSMYDVAALSSYYEEASWAWSKVLKVFSVVFNVFSDTVYAITTAPALAYC